MRSRTITPAQHLQRAAAFHSTRQYNFDLDAGFVKGTLSHANNRRLRADDGHFSLERRWRTIARRLQANP
jgi:hypothetical protein